MWPGSAEWIDAGRPCIHLARTGRADLPARIRPHAPRRLRLTCRPKGAQRAWELPCHRIVNAKGTLAPSYAFGGKENQRALLEAEGVAFLDDDTIDMRHHRWPPSDEPEQLTLGL